jgi:hypothetical protein
MNPITIFALTASLYMPSDRMAVAVRIAGEGLPNCQSYRADGSTGPCLPTFGVRRGGSINASSLAGRIIFTNSAVVRLNENEFALLAGHEIAHYYLGHKVNSMENEISADKLGAELACKAGYDPISGASLFRHFRRGKVHPSSDVRRSIVLSTGCKKPISHVH